MKKLTLICGVAGALLLAAACSTPAPSNNTAANANAANRNANAAAANTAASPAASPAANANNSNGASSSQAGAAQDFTLVNETGVEIDKVFISPGDKDDWEEDILGKDTLPSGQSVEIKFHREETAPEWDLKIEDKQGNAIEWHDLNLLKISKLTLHYKDGKGTADVE